jgi:proteasome lid subunit RPN8/RPN11
VITIVQRVLDDVRAHAREESPRECCGVLVGREQQILESARALNLAEGTTRFLIDPRDHIRAMREARARQLDVIGFYHSHPRSAAVPSETDIGESGYAGAMHLIVGFAENGAPEARMYVIGNGEASELKFVVVDSEMSG